MGKRKDTYYVKKRKQVGRLNNRNNNVTIRNVIRSLISKPKKVEYGQDSISWKRKRSTTIPSSLIRKAMNGSDKFLDHYEANPNYSIGSAIEFITENI